MRRVQGSGRLVGLPWGSSAFFGVLDSICGSF